MPEVYLGEDEHGVWLGGWPGDDVRRGTETVFVTTHGGLQLIPRDEWWAAWFGLDAPLEVYVDICTPPVWVGDTATTIDLDLDVIRIAGAGEVEIIDADELEAHTLKYGYPDDVVERVWSTARAIERRLVERDEPFGVAAQRWWSVREAAAP